MKRLPVVLMMAAIGTFLAFQTIGAGTKNPPNKYEQILKLVGEMLNQAHYSPQNINDDFSKKIFTKYIGDLDPEKNMFLQSDIEGLKKYETKIDDELKGAPVEFFLASGKVFNTKMEEAAKMYEEILSKPFDFTIDENVVLDGDKLNYVLSESDRKDRWRKKLKYMTLERYTDRVCC